MLCWKQHATSTLDISFARSLCTRNMLNLLHSESNAPIRTPQTFAITIVGIVVFAFVYRLAFDPLRDIPGPFLARLSRLWELQQVIDGNWHQKVIKLHQKYGMLFPEIPIFGC
jgi:hypothetical protein